METKLDKAVAAPVDIKLCGTKVTVYPLRLREWGRLERWMRQEIITAAKDTMLSDTSLRENAMRIIMSEATKSATGISVISKVARDGMLQSLGAMRQIIWLSLYKGNESLRDGKRELNIEIVDDLIGADFEAMAECVEAIFDLSLPDQSGKKQDDQNGNPPEPGSE